MPSRTRRPTGPPPDPRPVGRRPDYEEKRIAGHASWAEMLAMKGDGWILHRHEGTADQVVSVFRRSRGEG